MKKISKKAIKTAEKLCLKGQELNQKIGNKQLTFDQTVKIVAEIIDREMS